MSQELKCPKCGSIYAASDGLSPTDCPACGQRALQPTAPSEATAAPAVPNDEPDESMTWEEYIGWKKTAGGLRVLLGAVFLSLFVNIAIAAYADLANPAARWDTGDFSARQLTLLGGGCSALGLVFAALVGLLMCAAVPYQIARDRALGSMYCLAAAVIGGVLYAYIRPRHPLDRNNTEIANLILLAVAAFAFLAMGLWLLFHAAIADRFGERKMQTETKWLAVVWILASVAQLGYSISSGSKAIWESDSQAMLRMSFFFLNLIPTVWFATIIFRTFRLIDSKISGLVSEDEV